MLKCWRYPHMLERFILMHSRSPLLVSEKNYYVGKLLLGEWRCCQALPMPNDFTLPPGPKMKVNLDINVFSSLGHKSNCLRQRWWGLGLAFRFLCIPSPSRFIMGLILTDIFRFPLGCYSFSFSALREDIKMLVLKEVNELSKSSVRDFTIAQCQIKKVHKEQLS